MKNLTNKQLMQGVVSEIELLIRRRMLVRINLNPHQAMALVATIQLACRHPEFIGPTREIGEQIANRVQSEFLQYDMPHIIELIRRGWNPEYDEARGGE